MAAPCIPKRARALNASVFDRCSLRCQDFKGIRLVKVVILSLGRVVPGRLEVPWLKEVHHHGDAVRLEVLQMMSVDSAYGTGRGSGNRSQRFERDGI